LLYKLKLRLCQQLNSAGAKILLDAKPPGDDHTCSLRGTFVTEQS